MTGTHSGGPTGRRSSRSLAWRIGTPAVAVLCGSLFAVSATNSDGTDLRPGRYLDLAELVQGEADDYQRVEDRFNDLSAEVDRLGANVSDRAVNQARAKAKQLSEPAGLTAKTGPGLRITLSDGPEELLDEAEQRNRDLPPEERLSLNRFVVHQQDIQAVVNALWGGGATAITVAGQRIISTTGIKCHGNAVQLDGVPYPQPYVIEAVGDQGELLSAVELDDLVNSYRSDADNAEIGIGWSLDVVDEVTAPAYDAVIDLEYAKPLR